MAEALPPNPEIMKPIYREIAHILSRKGLSYTLSLAGCVRCGACSALPAYEQSIEKLICHPVRTEDEYIKAFRIRKAVFVQEQKLFKHTDADENDPKGIHLVAKQEGRIIGTVRVYPAGAGNGDWIGGRLAVRKKISGIRRRRTPGKGGCGNRQETGLQPLYRPYSGKERCFL